MFCCCCCCCCCFVVVVVVCACRLLPRRGVFSWCCDVPQRSAKHLAGCVCVLQQRSNKPIAIPHGVNLFLLHSSTLPFARTIRMPLPPSMHNYRLSGQCCMIKDSSITKWQVLPSSDSQHSIGFVITNSWKAQVSETQPHSEISTFCPDGVGASVLAVHEHCLAEARLPPAVCVPHESACMIECAYACVGATVQVQELNGKLVVANAGSDHTEYATLQVRVWIGGHPRT